MLFTLAVTTGTAQGAPVAVKGAPQDDEIVRSAASVVKVVTRDVSGNRVGAGIGFFVEIGRLVVPRALLLDRAYSAAVIYAGQEQRVTAVLADDARSGLVLVAVNLPDGAPPAMPTSSSTAATRPGRYHAVGVDGSSSAVEVAAERDLPGFGAACRVTATPVPVSGTPVVDDRGQMVGVVIQRSAGESSLTLLLPTARVVRLPPVGVFTLAEWLRRPQPVRAQEAEAAYLRGLSALLNDRPEEAAQHLRSAAAAGSGDAETHAALAASELASGRPEAAFDSYHAAVQADPDNARLHHDLALALGDAGRWEEAAGEFATVARLRPMDAEAYFNLGSAYGQLGRLDDEYTAYQAAIRENSAHVKALRNLGIVCIALKRYAEAVAVSAKALRLLPADAPLHAQLGVAYFDLGNYPTAIEELKKAVELEPDFVKAHYGLALVYAASGQKGPALAECETLKRLDPARGAEVQKMVAGR